MKQLSEYQVEVLIEDYKRLSQSLITFIKLQYGLAVVALLIAASILITQMGVGQVSQPVILLLLPLFFDSIVMLQLYLSAEIKSHSRYINFNLRPRLETIIHWEQSSAAVRHVWGWDEYYQESYPTFRFLIRSLGHFVYIFPFLFSIGTQMAFWILANNPWSKMEYILFLLDLSIGVVVVGFIVFIGLINEHWWKMEAKKNNL